jgi:hypothetical protein
MMASMRKGPSKELKAIAAEFAREYGIEPLREGEVRPMGYYLTEHYFDRGLRPVKPGKLSDAAKRARSAPDSVGNHVAPRAPAVRFDDHMFD